MNKFEYKEYFDLYFDYGKEKAIEYKNSFVPDKLYKYFSFSILEAENNDRIGKLINQELWLSRRSKLNDPFEFKTLYVCNNTQTKYHEMLLFMKNYVLDNMSIMLCLTADYKNKLMWSHYSDGYKGYCIEFIVTNKDPFFPVEYRKNRENITELFGRNISSVISKNTNEEIDRSILEVNYVKYFKDSIWKYEKEFRIAFDCFSSNDGEYKSTSELGLKINRIFSGINCDNMQKLIFLKDKLNVKLLDIDVVDCKSYRLKLLTSYNELK